MERRPRHPQESLRSTLRRPAVRAAQPRAPTPKSATTGWATTRRTSAGSRSLLEGQRDEKRRLAACAIRGPEPRAERPAQTAASSWCIVKRACRWMPSSDNDVGPSPFSIDHTDGVPHGTAPSDRRSCAERTIWPPVVTTSSMIRSWRPDTSPPSHTCSVPYFLGCLRTKKAGTPSRPRTWWQRRATELETGQPVHPLGAQRDERLDDVGE